MTIVPRNSSLSEYNLLYRYTRKCDCANSSCVNLRLNQRVLKLLRDEKYFSLLVIILTLVVEQPVTNKRMSLTLKTDVSH